MPFNNVLPVLRMGSPLSAWKLLLISASTSRPVLRAACLAMLQPFVRDGEIVLDWQCHRRQMKSFIRLSDLGSDLTSTRELGVGDTYAVETSFAPDLVVDAGGNIGLFTLRMAAALATQNKKTKIVICEPLPRNITQIDKHLRLNRIDAKVLPACVGGSRSTVPFYCREAINSSFDPTQPYLSVQQMPVYPLKEIVDGYPAERILIKIDIEGMETEALATFLPGETRPVYMVGELHRYAANARAFEAMFREFGWTFEFIHMADDNATFRACSPAAVASLRWPALRAA